jgi:hypothetical protein
MIRIYELAEELEAILLLEYHNKNHLAGSPKLRNECARSILRDIKELSATLGPK